MKLAILMYHHLAPAPSAVSIAASMFERQIEVLLRAGYALLPLGEALDRAREAWDTGRGAGQRLGAVTFDDGYASVHAVALPVLQRVRGRATVFAISQYVGRDNRWPSQPASVPTAPLMDWTQLTELGSQGWEIGAHTRTHPDLTRLSDREIATEIEGGKADLEDRLGRGVASFAYPYGRVDARARAVVRQQFRAACTTRLGWAGARSDPYSLERLEMWYFGQPGTPGLLGSPLEQPYVLLRRVGRQARALIGSLGRPDRAGRAGLVPGR